MTEILGQTNALPPNAQKVRALLAIAHIYVDHGRGKNLDTSLTYLNEAYSIGTAIRDTASTCEVLAKLCELYLFKGQASAAAALLPMAYGEERVRLLLIIAEGFVNPQPVDIPFLEKALPYLSKAIQLADSLRSTRWRYECLMVEAKYFFEHGNIENGRNAILTIIKNCDSLGDKKGIGNYWSEMNYYMPITNQTLRYHLFACRQSIRAYQQAGDQHDALYSLRDLAIMHRYDCEYDSAEKEFSEFLRETAKSGTTASANTNFELATLYLDKGDLPKALDYSFRALNAMGRTNNAFKRQVYGRLAFIYQETGVPAEELNYGRLAVEEAVRFQAAERHYFTTFVIDALVKEGYPERALAYLQEFNAANPVLSREQQEPIAYDYGLIYDALGAYPKADPWFRRLTELDTAAQQERGTTIFPRFQLNPFLVHLYTGRFYVHWGKYQQARPFLQKALADPLPERQSTARSELQLMLFETDSAAGDLRSAIAHYMLHTAIKDSVFNVEKMRQFQTLEVQYQTKQREQSFLLLRSESERQSALLNQESLARKIEFGGIIVLLMLAAWAYYAYQTKRRNVRRLLAQQVEINEKNLTLEQLLGEKDELLTQKNLLLQEVHHRVKNNLHTVMSLLESQSVYLNDTAARNALQDSQNRIQTISLLHQKLYWSSNVTTLEMAPYIAELCAFLASSLGARERRITISQFLDPIQLDIALGLPIGMLLNEAITNALKHAFPDNTDQNAAKTGHIEVTMQCLPDGLVSLQIADDGVGMPSGTGSDSRSLGMTLMKSIGQKLAGRFTIFSSDEGVRVNLEFRHELPGPSIN
jgi:two-component sensor histidine kinase